MAITKDFGPLFVHFAKLQPLSFPVRFAPTQEIDEPFRRSTSLVLNLWPTGVGVVLGLWRKTGLSEEDALALAMRGHIVGALDDIGVDGEDALENAEVRQAIRRAVADQGLDIDEEWTILSMLGVES